LKEHFNIAGELAEIGKMMLEASALSVVRREVSKIAKSGFVVTDGSHQDGGSDYEVVVRCGKDDETVARRIRASMPGFDVAAIAAGVIGVRRSRRV
jgi:hypothetical protein